MAPVVINSVVQLPVQVITLVLRKLRLVPTGSASHHTFPVAGLDEGRAHAVLYALRQAALDAQVIAPFDLLSDRYWPAYVSCVRSGGTNSRTVAGGSPAGADRLRQVRCKFNKSLACVPDITAGHMPQQASRVDDVPAQAPARLAHCRSQPRLLAEQAAAGITPPIYAVWPRPSLVCS